MLAQLAIPTDRLTADVLDAPVRVNPRLRTSLGRARWKRGKTGELVIAIELHPSLAADAEQYRDTVTHEVAHLAAGRGAGHGPVWRAWHRKLGGSARRTATVAEAAALGIERKRRKRSARRVVATCERCGFELVRARALAARRTYTHIGCGGTFRPGLRTPGELT